MIPAMDPCDVCVCAVDAEDVPGYTQHGSNARLHEAGYDALITGMCFVTMTSYLGQSAGVCD